MPVSIRSDPYCAGLPLPAVAAGGGEHSGQGDELHWDMLTRQAVLTAKVNPPVLYWDGEQKRNMQAARVTFDEPRGTLKAVGARFRGNPER